MTEGAPLVLVSNRGPVTHQDDGSIKRGTGGLVTALTGLASHRDAVWIASALTDGDKRRARKSGGEPFVVARPGGRRVPRAARRQRRPRPTTASTTSSRTRCCGSSSTTSGTCPTRRTSAGTRSRRSSTATTSSTTTWPRRSSSRSRASTSPSSWSTTTTSTRCRRSSGARGPTSSCTTSCTSRGRSPTRGACCRTRIRREIYEGLLANDIIGFHTRSYRWNFLQCCRDLMDLDVDFNEGIVARARRPRGLGARLPAADRLQGDPAGRPIARARRSSRPSCCGAGASGSILRVDRADLSKNVLRGFSAFDLFLEQHPEFRERVTFIAQLMPSRTDVPEYAEYLERIEALVAVVNHRHGTPDWMPIQLKLRDDLEEAMASYKHYDVLLVNAMFDGMNLVAKEGPLVNEHDGVSILSENTGAHEELGEFALSVNPFDIQETGRLDPRGAHDERRGARAPGQRAQARSSRSATRATGSTTSSRTSRAVATSRRRPRRLRAGRGLSYSTPNSLDGARHGAGAGGGVGRGRGDRGLRGAAVRAALASARLRGAPAGRARRGRPRRIGLGLRRPAQRGSGSGSGVVTGSAGAGAGGPGRPRPGAPRARARGAAARPRRAPRRRRARAPARRSPTARARGCRRSRDRSPWPP